MSAPLGPTRLFQLPGEEITWAGECPWTRTLSYGTESGKLVFVSGVEADRDIVILEVSEEAISEVAFWKDLVGVATRKEVLIFRGPYPSHELSLVTRFRNGAHGIIVTPRGRFLAPMGQGGMFCYEGGNISQKRGWVDRPTQRMCTYYKFLYVGESEGQEILAAATRADGLARIRLDAANARRVVALTAPSLDLVDTCSLKTESMPFAVAGLGLDRSIVFVPDLLTLNETDAKRLRFDQVRGTPYALLSARESIILLTSAELVIFPDLANRFLCGQAFGRPVPAHHLSVQAVDVFVASNRFLVVVTDEGVQVSEILDASSIKATQKTHDDLAEVRDWTAALEVAQPVPTDWAPLVA